MAENYDECAEQKRTRKILFMTLQNFQMTVLLILFLWNIFK